MKILKVKGTPFFDVFFGDGWKNWSRIAKTHGRIVVQAGEPLHQGLLNELLKRI